MPSGAQHRQRRFGPRLAHRRPITIVGLLAGLAGLTGFCVWPTSRADAQTAPRKTPDLKTADTMKVGVARPERRPFKTELLRQLKVPDGFAVTVFARDLDRPRMLLALDDGTVLVSRPFTNDVIALRDRDGDGRAESITSVVTGVDKAHGLARSGRKLYLAGAKKLLVGDLAANGTVSALRQLGPDLPDGGQHAHRTIGVGRDGALYLSVGSDCNDCNESNPEHATMLRVRPDGQRSIFARGLRNTIGFDWQAKTGDLWGFDIGTDWRGDDIPPEELNRITESADYGWPFCWGERQIDRTRENPPGTTLEKICAESKPSTMTLPAHASPIAFTFYRAGGSFPVDIHQDGFVAIHGSWNRAGGAIAPKVLRVHFENGKPVRFSDFLQGFLVEGGKAWFGRPAGLAIDKDGALLVSDDENGVIYRVSHATPRTPPASAKAADGDGAAADGGKPSPSGALQQLANITGFETPESVLHDEDQDVYFVSNVNGKHAEKDNNGFISKVAPDGTVKALKFIEGKAAAAALHAPKGMAIIANTLWVADIDAIRGFDRKTGAHVGTVDLAAQGAKFLNDVALGPGGALFVTDTGLQFDADGNRSHPGPDRIFRITPQGKATVALEGPFLEGPNGIAWDESAKRFVVVQNQGKSVLSWGGGAQKPTVLATGVGVFDGVVLLGKNRMLVSSHHDQVVYALENKQLTALLPSPPTPGDIGFDRKRNRLLVPSLKGNWVQIWHLPR